jgi:hypothetical protein
MKCPGQDMRYWKPGDIFETDCPHCGNKLEFFKDEATRRCRNCKNMVVNPKMNFGCAAYCQFAAQCLGDLGPELLAKRNDLLKDRVAIEVKRRLGKDFQRIGHAVKVATYAEEIARPEKAEPALVLCAAYLHVFFEPSEEHSAAEGRQKARDILEPLGAGPELMEKVLEMLDDFFFGRNSDSVNAKVLSDAHQLASLDEKRKMVSREGGKMESADRGWLTDTGRSAASKLIG